MIHMVESKGKVSRICLWPEKREISKSIERQLLTCLNGWDLNLGRLHWKHLELLAQLLGSWQKFNIGNI